MTREMGFYFLGDPLFLIESPDPGVCLHFQLNQVLVAGIHRGQLVIIGHCCRLVNVIGVRHWAEAISDFGRASSQKAIRQLLAIRQQTLGRHSRTSYRPNARAKHPNPHTR